MDTLIVYVKFNPQTHMNTFKFRYITKAGFEATKESCPDVFKTA